MLRSICCFCEQAAWDEALAVTGTDPAQVEDVEDDLARELAFYNQVISCIFLPPPFTSILIMNCEITELIAHVRSLS